MAQESITLPFETPVPSKDRLANGEERYPMPYEAYIDWLDEEGNHGEWVDGEVIVFEIPGFEHQDLVLWLGILLRTYVLRLGLGVVAVAPYPMRVEQVRSSRLPDVLFVATEHLDRRTSKRLLGPADLAVEIVSTTSGPRDHREKLAEYATAGVSEYWIIDPRLLRRSVTVYHLDDEQVYQSIPHRPDGTLDSAVLPDLRLPAAWLLDDPLPDLVDALDVLLASSAPNDR